MKDHQTKLGRPRKERTPVEICQDEFTEHFAKRFAGLRILKTPFHFFEWAVTTKGGKQTRNQLLEKFETYCRRISARQTWRNAAEWYVTGNIRTGA